MDKKENLSLNLSATNLALLTPLTDYQPRYSEVPYESPILSQIWVHKRVRGSRVQVQVPEYGSSTRDLFRSRFPSTGPGSRVRVKIASIGSISVTHTVSLSSLDTSQGRPWTRGPSDTHGSPHGSLVRNFNGVLTLYSFSVLKTEKIDTQHALYH